MKQLQNNLKLLIHSGPEPYNFYIVNITIKNQTLLVCRTLCSKNQNAIEAQLVVQSNLKKNQKEILFKYENECHEFSLVVPISKDKQVLISCKNNPSKDYFNYYHVSTRYKEQGKNFEKCAIHEAKEETDLPNKNDGWFFVDLKDLTKYKLTDSLVLYLPTITELVNKKFRNMNRSKKRKIELVIPEKILDIKTKIGSQPIMPNEITFPSSS
ncbi:1731_t:CDS:2, partial [Dentiscutata heterogama]